MRLLTILIVLLAFSFLPTFAQECDPLFDLFPNTYNVNDAIQDACTPTGVTDLPFAFSIPGLCSNLHIDTEQPHQFTVDTLPDGNITARLVARLVDNTTSGLPIAFDFVADFSSFSGRCNATGSLRLRLQPLCYDFLPEECYQCFDRWNATLVGVPGSQYEATIKVESNQAQVGLGANNIDSNFGLGGCCTWRFEKTCKRSVDLARSIIHKTCTLNVDLDPPSPPSVSGDPHIYGFRGQRFDFHGEVNSVFNLISDVNLQVNALFVNADLRPKKLHKTYIGELGFLLGQHRFRFACNRGQDFHIMELDGAELSRSKPMSLSDENYAMLIRDVNDKITIDYSPYLFRVWFSSSRHSSCHITLRASYSNGVSPNMPHGVMGQTVSPLVVAPNGAGPKPMQGEGIIEGVWMDYQIADNNLFGTNFRFNRFDVSLETDNNYLTEKQHDDEEDGSEVLSAASY